MQNMLVDDAPSSSPGQAVKAVQASLHVLNTHHASPAACSMCCRLMRCGRMSLGLASLPHTLSRYVQLHAQAWLQPGHCLQARKSILALATLSWHMVVHMHIDACTHLCM